jgi:hypothetical protein
MSLTKLSQAGNNLIIPGRREIPVGYGKIANLFYSAMLIKLKKGAALQMLYVTVHVTLITVHTNVENIQIVIPFSLLYLCCKAQK